MVKGEILVVDLECDNENIKGDNETPETKRFKTTTADCWEIFTKIGLNANGVGREKTNGCGEVFREGGKYHGTTTQNLHMDGFPKIKYVDVVKS